MKGLAAVVRLGALLLVTGCGASGDSDGDDAGTPPPPGGVVNPEPKEVSGAFFVGSSAVPAKGFELWLMDHTAGTYRRVPLSEAGAFSLPIAGFSEDHIYSMQVVKDFVHYGTVDFVPASAGLQGALRYAGGYGFGLGDVTLAVDEHDILPSGATPLAGTVGGGFALASSLTGTFDEMPPPAGVTGVAMGSQLIVMSPTTLLHSFYRANVNPTLYARDLAAWSRVGLRLTAPPGVVARVIAFEAGPWLATARLAAGDDVAPDEAPYWSKTAFDLTLAGDAFAAAALPGAVPLPGTLVGLRSTLTDGAAFVLTTRSLTKVLSQPPAVLAANAAGLAATAVDYASDTAKNGLTRPFCQLGAITLDVSPPLDGAGDVVVDGTFDRIEVELDYYGVAGGSTVLLEPVAAQFPAPYSGATSGETNGLAWIWDPAAARFSFTLASDDQTATVHTLGIADALFPAALGDAGVFKVRLRIYYRKTDGAVAGGVAFWLDNAC